MLFSLLLFEMYIIHGKIAGVTSSDHKKRKTCFIGSASKGSK